MALAPGTEVIKDIGRYSSLGLIANPFITTTQSEQIGADCEIAAEGNRLLRAILESSDQDASKPLWVEKAEDVPSYYYNAAMAHAEASLATDDTLNVLYAYMQLFTMRIGVTRASLNLLAERLSFRSFDRTLAAYVEQVLAEPDHGLASYQVMGPERLDAFAVRFGEDPLSAVHDCFGLAEYERQEELADVVDMRQSQMDEEVVGEVDSTQEVDETLGEAPGTLQALEERERELEAGEDLAYVRDYIVEYTREHLSSVVARALRLYHDRGLVAMSAEFKVTKAPRKTLAAACRLARARYRKAALLFDDFELWSNIDPDLRSKMVASFSEIRWKLAEDAFLVFLCPPGAAPEIEETFRGGPELDWSFPGLVKLQEDAEVIDRETVDRWLAGAAALGAESITLDDSVLSRLVEASEGSLSAFVPMARAAVEDAAERGVDRLDEESYAAGIGARP